MQRISLEMSPNAAGEAQRGFEFRQKSGFWSAYVSSGLVIDIGYKGQFENAGPIFREAIGLDMDTPGYNGRDIPFSNDSIGTVHASHLLEHIADYAYFFREVFRVLNYGGTLILMVPLMQAYENKLTPPSMFNEDHKRFYTSSRLLNEIETTLPRESYRILHLREIFNSIDFGRSEGHASGPYEIECVVEKILPNSLCI